MISYYNLVQATSTIKKQLRDNLYFFIVKHGQNYLRLNNNNKIKYLRYKRSEEIIFYI